MKTKYKETITHLEKERQEWKRKSRLLLTVKLISFTGTLLLIYGAFARESTAFYLCMACMTLIIYILALLRDSKAMDEIEKLEDMSRVCQQEISYLNDDFHAFEDGSQYSNPEHAFTYDLDIFGPDSLFQRINRTRTEGGSDRLAHKLSHLEEQQSVILANQEAISDLSQHFDWRLRFLAGSKIQSRFASLCQEYYLQQKQASVQKRWQETMEKMPYVTATLTLIALWGYILDWWTSVWFTLFFFLQLSWSLTEKKKIQKSLMATDQLHQEFKGYLSLLDLIQKEPFHAAKLQQIQDQLFRKKGNSREAFKKLTRLQNLFDQRSNALMYLVLNGLFVYDKILCRQFDRWIGLYAPCVSSWTDCISELDALVSLAQFSANNPQNTVPHIRTDNQDNLVLEAKDVYHPFLVHKHPVSNSFLLEKQRIAIVTGANMAGKSTFLRTIGINYILATTGCSVCARSFSCMLVSLFSSMRTADNLSRDISYFHAELLRIKQLLRHVKTHPYSLIILDEILKGTNSKDKLQGSILVLDELSQYHLSALIATHDLELARLEEKDPEHYRNYCFEIALSHDISYNYQIQKGVAQNLNASFLIQDILHSYKKETNSRI